MPNRVASFAFANRQTTRGAQQPLDLPVEGLRHAAVSGGNRREVKRWMIGPFGTGLK